MATILRTPTEWPSLLLGADAAAPKPLDDPASALDAAVAGGAFEGLKRCVQELGPTGTIATIAAAGLCGRGGAGFPTGEKWRLAARTATAPTRRSRRTAS
jgi:NADH:ubiquinone oxidoreductase subunit F (NADH-binding)